MKTIAFDSSTTGNRHEFSSGAPQALGPSRPPTITHHHELGADYVLVRRRELNELHITIQPEPGDTIALMLRRLDAILRGYDARVARMQVFGALAERAGFLAALRWQMGEPSWPVMWVEGGGLEGSPIAGFDVLAVSGADVETIRVRGRIVGCAFSDASARHCLLGDIIPTHAHAGNGVNTHHADSYVTLKLPADGAYRVHIGDTTRSGGDEYGYRLRISSARPDFALRVVPSSVTLRTKSTSGSISIYAQRKDGFAGPITVGLKDPPAGIRCKPVTISGTQTVARIAIQCDLPAGGKPFDLVVAGTTPQTPGQPALQHDAAPCEDRMQAFLWRHLVPAPDFKAIVFDPANKPAPKRVMPPPSPEDVAEAKKKIEGSVAKFTKSQVTGRLRQIETLYQEGLLTDTYASKLVAECTVQE